MVNGRLFTVTNPRPGLRHTLDPDEIRFIILSMALAEPDLDGDLVHRISLAACDE